MICMPSPRGTYDYCILPTCCYVPPPNFVHASHEDVWHYLLTSGRLRTHTVPSTCWRRCAAMPGLFAPSFQWLVVGCDNDGRCFSRHPFKKRWTRGIGLRIRKPETPVCPQKHDRVNRSQESLPQSSWAKWPSFHQKEHEQQSGYKYLQGQEDLVSRLITPIMGVVLIPFCSLLWDLLSLV